LLDLYPSLNTPCVFPAVLFYPFLSYSIMWSSTIPLPESTLKVLHDPSQNLLAGPNPSLCLLPPPWILICLTK
jgi:hypothetical protein